nr:endolytic transglycosylase MltG [Nocardioidaceae bacterium]
MSDIGVGGLRTDQRRSHRGGKGCLAALVAVAVIVALGVFAYVEGVELIKDKLTGPEDYAGDGRGSVVVSIKQGTLTDIGVTLEKAGVVKSVRAFTEAANVNSDATSIAPGSYRLRKQMSAESALGLLLDPDSLIKNPTVTIPEGMRAQEILASIVKQTDLTTKQLQAAYDDTAGLGLPKYANGDPEGYLFPSTYELTKKTTATGLLKQMVAKFVEQADALGLEEKASALGYSPHDIVTVASLVQAEAGPADMKKVASVVYNRLDVPMALEFDSTLHFAADSRGQVVAPADLRKIDSPYNTYKRAGLPPGPIDSPGEEALTAALTPAQTDFIYFVTVNLNTGETRFAASYAEHLRNVDVYH